MARRGGGTASIAAGSSRRTGAAAPFKAGASAVLAAMRAGGVSGAACLGRRLVFGVLLPAVRRPARETVAVPMRR